MNGRERYRPREEQPKGIERLGKIAVERPEEAERRFYDRLARLEDGGEALEPGFSQGLDPNLAKDWDE